MEIEESYVYKKEVDWSIPSMANDADAFSIDCLVVSVSFLR